MLFFYITVTKENKSPDNSTFKVNIQFTESLNAVSEQIGQSIQEWTK